MADQFEVTLDVRLRDDVTDADVAELRWHLGLGPEPETLRLVPDFGDEPYAILGEHGDAWKTGGVLTAAFDPATRHVTCRQELHPDQFPEASALLTWMAAHSASGPVIGHLRFYESDDSQPITGDLEALLR